MGIFEWIEAWGTDSLRPGPRCPKILERKKVQGLSPAFSPGSVSPRIQDAVPRTETLPSPSLHMQGTPARVTHCCSRVAVSCLHGLPGPPTPRQTWLDRRQQRLQGGQVPQCWGPRGPTGSHSIWGPRGQWGGRHGPSAPMSVYSKCL